MLVNPYTERHRLDTYGGTRILRETLGVVGSRFPDPLTAGRAWTITTLYAPIPERALGGVRAKLTDGQEFITFINQRDLEVLLGLGRPGSDCAWAKQKYVAPDDRDWIGCGCDEDDLQDDLLERELLLRAQAQQPVLQAPLEIVRHVCLGDARDVEEIYVLIWDADPETGYGPDTRLGTISRRWCRSERSTVQWNRR